MVKTKSCCVLCEPAAARWRQSLGSMADINGGKTAQSGQVLPSVRILIIFCVSQYEIQSVDMAVIVYPVLLILTIPSVENNFTVLDSNHESKIFHQ